MADQQANGIMIVMTNPKEGREDDYNDWYNNVHLPEVVNLSGFVGAKRYKVNGTNGPEGTKYSYLAIYEVEAGELENARAAIGKAMEDSRAAVEAGQTPVITPTDSTEPGRILQWFDEVTRYQGS